jgi:muramoyltetrapeptide carboxypeptidase LdcA involved in peptidoglycan recycling
MEIRKPARLRKGDTVAVVSTSWGGPHVFPHVFDKGVAVLRERFELRVREMPTTRMSPEALELDPQRRAADLNEAFADSSVHAIFATIGGNDSARILSYLDIDTIRANPKIFMGYSDTIAQLAFVHQLGLVTFQGPAVMAGFAQLENFPEAQRHVCDLLFDPQDRYTYNPYPAWAAHYEDWNDLESDGRVATPVPHDGWHWINGSGSAVGHLFGGCIEVLEFLKGTEYWPTKDFWNDRIVFFETSEDKPTLEQIRYWLFNYGLQGLFDRASALLFGRARDYSPEEKQALDSMIVEVVVGQFGASQLPIVTNLDFGHTDPQWIVPLGVVAEIDCVKKSFTLLEAAVI